MWAIFMPDKACIYCKKGKVLITCQPAQVFVSQNALPCVHTPAAVHYNILCFQLWHKISVAVQRAQLFVALFGPACCYELYHM